jgi:hypothetical protein
MGIVRSISVPYLVISWLCIAAVNVAAQQELSGTVVDESGSALPARSRQTGRSRRPRGCDDIHRCARHVSLPTRVVTDVQSLSRFQASTRRARGSQRTTL